jgi:hypothetical protein
MRRYLLAAVLAALMAMASAGTALAGEVKGPPGDGSQHNTAVTGALDHARSECAASGLNDWDPEEGQNESQVQTAADSWKYYGMPKGIVGELCQGAGAG